MLCWVTLGQALQVLIVLIMISMKMAFGNDGPTPACAAAGLEVL